MNRPVIYAVLGLLLLLPAGCVYDDYDYSPPPPRAGDRDYHHHRGYPPPLPPKSRHHQSSSPQYHGEQQYRPQIRQPDNMWPDQYYGGKKERTGH